MPNVVGFEKGYWVKTCVRCGNVFRTRDGEKTHCFVCVDRIKRAECMHKGTAHGSKTSLKSNTADIARLSKLAVEHGMSYGKYVAKYGKQ